MIRKKENILYTAGNTVDFICPFTKTTEEVTRKAILLARDLLAQGLLCDTLEVDGSFFLVTRLSKKRLLLKIITMKNLEILTPFVYLLQRV